jgi:GntR family transcriptional regulator
MKSKIDDQALAIWKRSTNSILLDSQNGMTLHRQLKSQLQCLIEKMFDDTTPFMTEDYLIASLGISRTTVRRALSDLAADGFLKRRRAVGTVVQKNK